MGGGLIQLYSNGPQDIWLTGNPTITFFKKVYRKYTNYAVEEMDLVFIGEKQFGKRLRCKIERKGDLLKDMYLKIKIKNGPNNNQNDNFKNIIKCGYALIDYVEIEIGGLVIDKHYGEWMDIWSQLSMTSEKYDLLRNLIRDRRNKLDIWEGPMTKDTDFIYIPLQFWFNKDPGLALPLIALQYHDIVLNVKFKKKKDVRIIVETANKSGTFIPEKSNSALANYGILPTLSDHNNDTIQYAIDGHGNAVSSPANTDLDYQSFLLNPSIDKDMDKNHKWNIENFTGEIIDLTVVASYIFLDKDERKKFAQNSHEYLITQVQKTNKYDLLKLTKDIPERNMQIKLEFNHPVKEIFWTVNSKLLENTFFYKNMDFSSTLKDILIQVNGIDRIPKKSAYYFQNIEPFKHHTCGGIIPGSHNNYYSGGFYIYSFAMNPENYQPSGSLNFSVIKNCTLNFNYKKTNNRYSTIDEKYSFICYGLSYNILRIENGMGGLTYTN